jgi:hypothetical protein
MPAECRWTRRRPTRRRRCLPSTPPASPSTAPLTQDLGLWKYGWFVAAAGFGLDFLLNLAQAAVLRRHGFTAAIALRVAFYAVWHVAYPH